MTRSMTSAAGVLHQQNISSPKDAAGTVGYFNLDRSIEQHNELTRRRRMPVVVVARIVPAKHDGLHGDALRQVSDFARIAQLDLDISEVRLALIVTVDTGDFHARS